jgi:hypothetical protein
MVRPVWAEPEKPVFLTRGSNHREDTQRHMVPTTRKIQRHMVPTTGKIQTRLLVTIGKIKKHMVTITGKISSHLIPSIGKILYTDPWQFPLGAFH